MAGSILLHLTVLIMVQPALPPQEERLSAQAIEVTLETLAPSATPAPPVVAASGQDRPAGSMDLVQTAQAPGPLYSALPLQRPLSESPVPMPEPSAWQAAETTPDGTVILLQLSLAAAAAANAAPRAPDASDRLQAPPTSQPQRQAARHSAQQNPNAPDPRTDAASYASQRDAEQDYVLQVVRKLSQSQFFPQPESQRSPRGTVIARLTVDRDGNLVGLSLAKDSGSASIDRGILEKVRKMAPFAALPQDLVGSAFSFIVPIKFAQEP